MDKKHFLQQLNVSVVMCTYNGAAFVEEQLQSILKQTYPLKEILIFDDVSTDDTVLIIQKIAKAHPIISLFVNTTNLGYNRNFEQALIKATGDVIAISDQDDVWMPEKTEIMMNAWKPETPLIYCTSVIFEKNLSDKPFPWTLIKPFEGTDGRRLFLRNTISGHSLMIRKKFLHLALPFPDKVMYDWWLSIVAAYNGGVQYVDKVLVYQRKHQQNVTLHKGRYTLEELKKRNKQETINNNYSFSKIEAMPVKHRRMALKFAVLMEESLKHAFYLPLFLFLFRNRNIFFNYIGHEPLIWYNIKHSYRQSSRKVGRSL